MAIKAIRNPMDITISSARYYRTGGDRSSSIVSDHVSLSADEFVDAYSNESSPLVKLDLITQLFTNEQLQLLHDSFTVVDTLPQFKGIVPLDPYSPHKDSKACYFTFDFETYQRPMLNASGEVIPKHFIFIPYILALTQFRLTSSNVIINRWH